MDSWDGTGLAGITIIWRFFGRMLKQIHLLRIESPRMKLRPARE